MSSPSAANENSSASAYRWYVLGILALTYAFSYMDRQILSILLEDLRAEFSLSDTQLGLLSGLAFALFYSILGIPIARLADRYNRINIISAAVALWSAVTVLCGAVTSFAQLFIARIGVGIGEAGGTPPAHSVISDYFGPSERSTAISIYSLGTAVGGLMGLVIGGTIAENFGWRWAFVAAGLPGIALALLVKLSVREPPRGSLDKDHTPTASPIAFRQTLLVLWNNVIYRRVTIGHVFAVFVGYGLASWLPALYLRQFELGQSAVGGIVGLINLTAGVPGLIIGGLLADRLAKSDVRWRGWVPAVAVLAALPLYLLALLVSSLWATSILFGLGIFAYSISHGPGLAVVQVVLTSNLRAQGAAFVFFFSNLIGLGIGPVLVGFISDLGQPRFGEASLNLALAVLMLMLIPAGIWYWRAGAVMRNED